MRPLEFLASESNVADLLKAAPAAAVQTELDRLQAGLALSGQSAAAWQFATGALALRKGELAAARADLEGAAAAFAQCGATQAEALARCEAQLAILRMGPYSVHARVRATLQQIAEAFPSDAIVYVTATHYLGTAHRFSGNVDGTLDCLADALARSEGLLAERAQVLNSLGTLYVLLGAFGAAEALLAHAAELAHQLGDKVGEAISHGQLGSAALAQHAHEGARRHLQRQEWLASQTGDTFGQARALTMLAELAMDTGRHDDALLLAAKARRIAESVTPTLPMWAAYAARVELRARLEMGDRPSRGELEACREAFRQQGNRLGAALVQGDLARLEPSADPSGQSEALWVLASLGLTGRVAQHLVVQRQAEQTTSIEQEELLAAAAQAHAHIAHAHEHELVYHAPLSLARIGRRRLEGHRNLGRLTALALEPAGLWVAAIARPGQPGRMHPDAESRAAAIAFVGTVSLWAWPMTCAIATVIHDLGRAAREGHVRIALVRAPEGAVSSAPFLGEPGIGLGGVDALSLLGKLSSVRGDERALVAVGDMPWDPRAEAAAATWRLLVRLEGHA